MLKFNITDNNYIQRQNFSIPSPVIRYLMTNIDSKNLKKLYQTCKYFYARLPINVVDELCIENELTVIEKGPYFFGLSANLLYKLPNKLWLIDFLLLVDNINLSEFFSKIHRCDLTDLYLDVDTKFTINDLKILTQSNTIKNIDIEMKIYTFVDEDTVAPLEDVMTYLLSANSISFEPCCFTDNTMKKLLNLNFQEKLERFYLCEINLMPNADLMDQFLRKNLENKAYVGFDMENNDQNLIFNEQMLEKINAWIPEEKKPYNFPRSFMV